MIDPIRDLSPDMRAALLMIWDRGGMVYRHVPDHSADGRPLDHAYWHCGDGQEMRYTIDGHAKPLRAVTVYGLERRKCLATTEPTVSYWKRTRHLTDKGRRIAEALMKG